MKLWGFSQDHEGKPLFWYFRKSPIAIVAYVTFFSWISIETGRRRRLSHSKVTEKKVSSETRHLSGEAVNMMHFPYRSKYHQP